MFGRVIEQATTFSDAPAQAVEIGRHENLALASVET